jgi:hypothetical protein
LDEKTKQKAVEIPSRDVYRGFGPTLAAEYLDSKHGIQTGRETVRMWMIEGSCGVPAGSASTRSTSGGRAAPAWEN